MMRTLKVLIVPDELYEVVERWRMGPRIEHSAKLLGIEEGQRYPVQHGGSTHAILVLILVGLARQLSISNCESFLLDQDGVA